MGFSKKLGRGLTVLVMLLAFGATARADQTVYDNALENGWANWSWCTTNFAAANYVHSGSSSAQVTYTAGWQGFYLHHDNFNSSTYTALQFWINGGAVAGRTINVSGVINGSGQPPVALSRYASVSAGAWTHVTIPLTDLHIDHNATVSGFWLQEATGSPQPAFYVDDISLTAVPPPSTVHLNVNANQILQQVDGRVFGINTAVWDAQFGNSATIQQLRRMGTRILRYPGGSLSDGYHWQSNTTDGNTWQWATNFDTFAVTAKNAGADSFITVNYGSGSAQEAANWVAYSNKTKGYGFHYWEIGNECFGSWEYDLHNPAHDPYTYAVQAKAYITAMKAVDPTIKIGVVVITGEDSYANNNSHPATNPRTKVVHNGWTPVMLTTLKSLGVTPDFVIHHRYEQGPGNESDSYLLQAAAGWKNDAADLRQQLNDYLGAAGSSVEIDCTENNSVTYNPGKQTTSLVNGLYYADTVGQLIQTEIRSLVWYNLRNGGTASGDNNSASLYGWRLYGDYGVIENNQMFPVFFTSRLMSLFMGPGDSVVPATSDYNLLSIYAVKRRSGSLSLLVINKDPSATLSANFALSGFTPAGSATVYSYGIPQDNAAKTGVGSQDVAQSGVSGISSAFTMSFAPYSATVLSITKGQ